MATEQDTVTTLQLLQSQIDSLNQSVKKTVGTPISSDKTQLVSLSDIPQGPGSQLDSDTVDGIHASFKPQPNCLVPLSSNNQFVVSVIPTSGGGGSGFLLGNGAPTDKNILIADGTLWQSRAASGDISITADTGTFHVIGIGNITTGVLGVAHGGTGDSTLTAYSVLCGGTTTTSAVQSVASLGTAGQVLTSNGSSALPTWQTSSSSSPGGNTGDIQFNSSGSFAGTDNLFWDNSGLRLGIQTNSPDSILHLKSPNNSNTTAFHMQTNTSNTIIGKFEDTGHGAYIQINSGGGSLSAAVLYANGGTNYWQVGNRLNNFGANNFSIWASNNFPNDYALNLNVADKGVGIWLSSFGTAVANTFEVGIASKFDSTIQVSGDTTGSGTPAGLGTNCPATTLTAPYTWLKFISSDGSTVYCPAYK